MVFVVEPRLKREVQKCFDFEPQNGQLDYWCERLAAYFPLAKAALLEDAKKQLTKAKAGDKLVLIPSCHFTVRNRIIQVEVHQDLYTCGELSPRRLYKHGDKAFDSLVWTCNLDYDLKQLPYLYEVFIVDEHVR